MCRLVASVSLVFLVLHAAVPPRPCAAACVSAAPSVHVGLSTQTPLPHTDLPSRSAWRTASLPRICHALQRNGLAPDEKSCPRRNTALFCHDGRARFFSQMHQDYYLYTRHFSKLRRRGVYVDVGANDPTYRSNTYFMDACLGWTGLCVEAQPHLVAKLYHARSCALVPTCVSDRGDTVSFALMGGLSGVLGTNKNGREVATRARQGRTTTLSLKCTTLRAAFARHGVRHIDYMSVDVEGHEMHALRGIDWGHVIVNVLTIETQKEAMEEVETFLTGKGYVRHWPDYTEKSRKSGLLWEDMVFLHKSVKFGKPE